MGVPHLDDDSPFYDDYDVNGAVVPFSWEQKPGVPLMFNPNYLYNIKEKEEVGGNHEEKAPTPPLLLQSSLQSGPNNQLLLPLPKPPAALHISFTNTLSTNVSNTSSSLIPSSLSYTSPKTHIHKHRRVSFQTYLNNKQANIITEDDPFLRAIQACTESSMKGAQEGGGRIDARLNNHSTSNNGVQKMSSKASFSSLFDGKRSPLRKKFDEKVLSARSPLRKKFDDKELDTNASLSKVSEIFDDKVLSNNAQLSKLNYGDFDGMVLSTKAQLSKLNHGDFDDKVLSTKASKAKYGAFDDKVLASYKSPIRRCNGAFDEKVLASYKSRVRKLIVEREGSGKQERYNGHPAFMVASFHQSAKQKKPITHKPVRGRPLDQRSSSYGCKGCSSAEYYDSIIRL